MKATTPLPAEKPVRKLPALCARTLKILFPISDLVGILRAPLRRRSVLRSGKCQKSLLSLGIGFQVRQSQYAWPFAGIVEPAGKPKHHCLMDHKSFSSVDDVVRMSIEDLFPDQTIPDQENYRADGTQFKAPDHAIFNGKVLIERKSRNPRGRSSLYEKLQGIAEEQGAPFRAYGKVNIGNIISSLPDPTRANQEIVDFLLGQTMKIVRKAKLKFEEYDQERGKPDQIRILVISDHSDMIETTSTTEQFLGRKMGGYDQANDETGLIDAVFFLKHPALTIDEQNSYWFKAILKRTLNRKNRTLVEGIAAAMHYRVSNYGPYNAAASRFTLCRYRPLIA